MKPLFGHLGSLLGCVICLYGALWVLSIVTVPPTSGGLSLDTSQASRSIYMTEPKYVYLNRAPLGQAGAKVVLVGASNTVVGFRQAELAPLISDATVANLAIGGANITETAQVVGLVAQAESPATRNKTTFVIGVWYGMFGSDKVWWTSPDRHTGETDIDIERYRYGFCLRTDEGPLTLVPSGDFDLARLAIHPYLVGEMLVRNLSTYVDAGWIDQQKMRSEQQRNDAVVDEAEKEQLLSYWTSKFGTTGEIPDEQFGVLEQLISQILAMGSNVVLVDLPLPNWHATRSPFLSSYYQQLLPVVNSFQDSPHFQFLRLKGLSDDQQFSDEVHPKPRVSVQWAQQLARALNRSRSPGLSLATDPVFTISEEALS